MTEIEPTTPGASPGERAHEAAAQPRPATVLVVDDEADLEPLIRQRFRRRIRRGELTFLFAGDGEEALARLRENPDVAVVLTDINMPRMDGLTLLAELSKLRDPDTVLGTVVVTAYGDMMNIRTAMNRGAFDFLTKPIDLDDLEVTVDKAVARVEELKRALHARETVGRYLSDAVAEQLLSGPEALQLGGERRRVSILMSDLRGFSVLSERLPPERVLELLNVHLGKMAEVIGEFGGTIDEYIGDGILVLFGAPTPQEDHARRAVACALAMQLAMADVNAEVRARGLPPVEMGVGINTGDVVVGNIGSEKRAKYGVVGSPVNMAGRVEAATVGGQVLVTESTRTEAGGDVEVRRTLRLAAKGFSAPIPLFEVVGIGAPYDLRLPTSSDRLVALAQPLAVRFHVLEGKQLGEEALSGEITAVSAQGGILGTSAPLEPLADLRLRVPDPEAPERPAGDLYAKVLEVAEAGYVLHFTAVPEPVAAVLAGLYEAEV